MTPVTRGRGEGEGEEGCHSTPPLYIYCFFSKIAGRGRGRLRTLSEAVELNATINESLLLLKAHGPSRALSEAVELNAKSMKMLGF